MSDTIETPIPASPSAAPGVGEPTLPAAFQATAAARGDQIALIAFGDDRTLTWAEYSAAVEEIATGLYDIGVRHGDTVALMLSNSPEFHIVDTAVQHLGATPFSIYLTSAPEQISYLFDNADNKVLVAESRFLDVISRTDTPGLDTVVVVDALPVQTTAPAAASNILTLDDVRRRRTAGFDFEQAWRSVQPSDLATLIYTSGTTGAPKGVELTHANLMFVMHTCNQRFPFDEDGAAISYLPTAHAADRVFSHYLSTVTGWPITTVADAGSVFGAVAQARPSWFLGVPRVWEKLRAALLARFNGMPDAQRVGLLGALDAANERVQLQQRREVVPADLEVAATRAESAIFGPLRAQLGLDRVSLLMTGAAPIAPAVHEFFLALGLPLQEGFGMSETGALGFTNIPSDIRVGKVGLAQPGTEAKLAADGELLLRGPHVMRGYRKDPQRTAEAVDSEGWLYTGDIATIDPDGWVSIVDRKKELIINAAGKNMSPVNIESKLKSATPLIGQVCVIGDGRPYNVALIVLDPDSARTFATEHGLPDASLAALIGDPSVKEAVDTAVAQTNAQLSRVEQIKTYRLLDAEWLPDSEELTPTMKLKRRGIGTKYHDVIEDIYASSSR
ncbi:AMP-dependent synthetase/ligase [Williamsia soli]|uniref:AMP-dependent synthetase/ligase n=1 Tax=Williamsia soli TaxID=364929 RepID=UPI001A9EF56A|nr:AMP-dependent synthetase/ligase [Williamsia soli]